MNGNWRQHCAKRRAVGLTQQKPAEQLNLSFQAVSKWENGATLPDIALLPQLAAILRTSVDALVGYQPPMLTLYEEKYQDAAYYWGMEPNRLCCEILKLRPPIQPLCVLDMGCGEGKDAVFLSRNGSACLPLTCPTQGFKRPVSWLMPAAPRWIFSRPTCSPISPRSLLTLCLPAACRISTAWR